MKKIIGWVVIISFFFGCTPSFTTLTTHDDNWSLREIAKAQEQIVEAMETLATKVGIVSASLDTKEETKPTFISNFGCTPSKPREEPKMPESKPEPKPAPPPVKKVYKPVILSVKVSGNVWTVKVNRTARVKNAKVRLFIGYCYYEGQIQSDGIAKILVEWSPPSGGKAVSVFQQTDNPEIGSGNTLCSMRI